MRVQKTAYYCCVFIFLNCSWGFTQTYDWPLRQNYGVSATFGEYRYDHFHAGIDLSTNGETGLPVVAAADGHVYRLKIQKRAYGKALYIRHLDGMISVYAHLESYSTELGLEQLYQKRIAELGTRYVGDIMLDAPVAVKKGEVVAFSGESGAGLPHLHFELRKTESVAINPLTNGLRDSLDPVAPTFQAFYMYPLNADSAVEGNPETKMIRLKKKDLYYVPENTPVVRGDFIVSVSAYDSALRPYHRGPYKLAFSIDKQLLYSLAFNELSYVEPPGLGLVYDLGKPGPSYFEHPILLSQLAESGTELGQTVVPFATGALTPGIHTLQIEAVDSNNNSSLAHIDFIVNRPPSIRIENVSADGMDMVVNTTVTDTDWKANGPFNLAAEVEYSADEGKSFLPFPRTILDTQSGLEAVRISHRIPLDQIPVSRILVKARGYDGIEYSSYALADISIGPELSLIAEGVVPQGKVEITPYSNSVKVSLDTQRIVPVPVSMKTGTPPVDIPMIAADLISYEAILPVPKTTGQMEFAVAGNATVSLPVYYVARGTSARIKGGNYELLFEPDNLYWDTFVWPKILPYYPARYMPLIGPMVQLGPRGVPMKNKAAIRFQYPADLENPERLNVYIWNRISEKWSPIASKPEPDTNTVVAGISYFDLFALIYDNVAPVITPIFPKRNSSTSNTTPKLAATIRDTGMDVDDEKVTFYVDNNPYTADYDPDRNVATLKIETPLSKGSHSFYVVAADYAGNRTQSTKIIFRIR